MDIDELMDDIETAADDLARLLSFENRNQMATGQLDARIQDMLAAISAYQNATERGA